ncbi:hypothetical protein PoB_002317400 [Plakobranchus ocellatus]|uniref:Uncharacterized protein n=1 Tax=Plakobranchus ocellatus TaxID=259542 RepID=A0AAV3ZS21_9GAST|nr:hypothetical protein PoB_002317400 [Plakobranchus ocellatus]
MYIECFNKASYGSAPTSASTVDAPAIVSSYRWACPDDQSRVTLQLCRILKSAISKLSSNVQIENYNLFSPSNVSLHGGLEYLAITGKMIDRE